VAEAMNRVAGECPDLETIAAYLDDRLGERERARIAEHLASCSECYFVLTESAHALASVTPPTRAERARAAVARFVAAPRVPRMAWASAGAGLATAAAIVLLIVSLPYLRRTPVSRPDLAELVAAVGEQRMIEPRLSGGFAYAPLQSPTRGESSTLPPDLRIAAARIEKAAAADRTPQALAALGAAYALTDKPDEGVTALESATRDAPAEATYWSDLAAAYIVRAQRERRLEDLTRAVDAADRATRIAPGMPEAWFNRALAIERIGGLREEAKRAWEDYVKVDATSEWSAEAKRHIAALSAQSRATWSEQQPNTVRALDRTDREALVIAARRFPRATREYVLTDLLPVWVDAQRRGRRDDARVALTRARVMAAALAEATSDPMLSESLESIGRLAPADVEAFASAWSAFADGKRLLDANRVDAALQLFADAERTLERLRNPLLMEARLQLAAGWYRVARYDKAIPLMQQLANPAAAGRYLWVNARAHQALGLVFEHRGDLTAAQQQFDAALATFDRIGDHGMVAFLHNLLAEDFRHLGQTHESWRHFDEALSRLDALDSIRDIIPILSSAANACLTDEMPGSALLFFDAIRQESLATGDPVWIVPANLHLADTHGRVGAYDAALDDLRRAREAARTVTDASVARRLEADILAQEGEVLWMRRPADAVEKTTTAIAAYERTTLVNRLPALFLNRARAYEQLARIDLAEADYLSGISLFEQEHARVAQERFRASHYDRAWDLFTEMIRFQAVRHRRPDLAMAFAERARARTLLEAVSNGTPPSFTVDQLQALLPHHVAVVSYVVLPDRLLAWVTTRARSRFVDIAVSAGRLASAVEAHQAEIAQRSTSRSRETAAARLYDLVISPIAEHLPPGAALVFVPDGSLHRVAFAALINGRSRKYLVEDHAVAIAPSLALSVGAGGLDAAGPAQQSDVLVVGNPQGTAALADLPEAEAEARDVASLYEKAVVLTGAEATKRRFLGEVGRHDVVHFAGHAIQNAEFPWLSRLAFAGDGDDERDLFAHEVAAQPLSGVRLVVLAACSTAAGPAVRGEGVLSLARPFMSAGVPAIVATLWDVNDHASRLLLTAFHRRIARGAAPGDALRRAQLELLASGDPALAAPASWSGFVAIGTVSRIAS